MRLLIDTQCWLWMHLAPERFSDGTRALLLRTDTDVLLSVASIWEIVIKHSLGKLRLPEPVDRWIPSRIQLGETTVLAIEPAHALRVAGLPPAHRDPFDRMIVAQALVEDVPVLTADEVFAQYGIRTMTP